MEEDVLVVEGNLRDNYEQEITSLETILGCPEFNMDFTADPIQTQKPVLYKICRCGNIVYESPANQFRCGRCGNIKYNRKEGLI